LDELLGFENFRQEGGGVITTWYEDIIIRHSLPFEWKPIQTMDHVLVQDSNIDILHGRCIYDSCTIMKSKFAQRILNKF